MVCNYRLMGSNLKKSLCLRIYATNGDDVMSSSYVKMVLSTVSYLKVRIYESDRGVEPLHGYILFRIE